MSKANSYNKYINQMAIGCRCPKCRPKTCTSSCSCDSSSKCSSCSSNKSAPKKETDDKKLDGCICRKCKEFFPMAEADADDGMCTCWSCKNIWV